MAKLTIDNVSFSYGGDHNVLNNINLVLENKSTAIIGQNGAGKTTFVKLLKKLLIPTEGNIYFNDENISTMTAAQLAKYIGLVFQNPSDQIFKTKVLDEVMFGPLNIGFSEQEAKDAAIASLEAVSLSSHAQKNPYDLSLAERKRITIASVLAMNTDVIIFDEPTMGQDYEGKQQIIQIIKQLKQDGKLVLCILHDMDFTAEVFERVLVFRQGEVLLDGTPEDVFKQKKQLEEAYLEQPNVLKIASKIGLSETIVTKEQLIHKLSQLRNEEGLYDTN